MFETFAGVQMFKMFKRVFDVSVKVDCLNAKLLLMALASTVILGFKSHGTHDPVLYSDASVSLPIYVPIY
jgi:hypothetical protein